MIEVKIAEYEPTFVVYIANDMIAFDRHDACGSCEFTMAEFVEIQKKHKK